MPTPSYTPAYPPLREITGYLTGVRRALAGVIADTPQSSLDRAPAGGGWSGTMIIQHLGIVEGMATKRLEGLFAAGLADGLAVAAGAQSWLHSLDQFNILDRTVRIAAPERALPAATSALAPSWASLQDVRSRLFNAIATVDGRDLTTVSAPHPIFGALNGYQWIVAIGKHEERHLLQLRETLSAA